MWGATNQKVLEPRVACDGRTLLNLGCGARFHGDWTNVDLVSTSPDVIGSNVLCGIPFRDNSFDVVYHCHLLEHFSRGEAVFLMTECCRVTKVGGRVRVVVPDLEYNSRLYLRCLEEVVSHESAEALERYEWSLLNQIDQMTRTEPGGEMVKFLGKTEILDFDFLVSTTGGPQAIEIRKWMLRGQEASRRSLLGLNVRRIVRGLLRRLGPTTIRVLVGGQIEKAYSVMSSGELHKWAYDRFSLKALLEETGFKEIAFCEPNESAIHEWSFFCLEVDPKGKIYKPNSLFVEGVKR